MVKRMCVVFVFCSICVAQGQQRKSVSGSIAVPVGKAMVADRVDLRLAHKPLVREDVEMKTGRELRQGQAVVSVRPVAQDMARQTRVLRNQQDRAKIKRVVAINSTLP